MYNPKMIYTDNPFADYVIYWTKYMAMNSIIKDETKANAVETVDSLRNFDKYLICKSGRQFFNLWDNYPLEVYLEVLKGIVTDRRIIRDYMNDKEYVPEEYRQKIVDEMAKRFLESYEESNSYYREICGLRPLDNTCEVVLEEYGFVNDLAPQDAVYYTYLHDASNSTLLKLYNNGILERIMNDYPDEKWIQCIPIRLNSNNILDTIEDARKALNFELLYIPNGVEDTIKEQFVEKYNLNRDYVLHNIYSDAYKIGSDYYDNFIQVLIIIMTTVDMLDSVSEHIVRKDIIDARCIQYIFEQYGIPYYNEIPIKYQMNMVKNINTLLKFKSSAKCMVDICSLFGFDSSQIFQLYLLRKRRLDGEDNFVFNYKGVSTPRNVGIVSTTSTTINIKNNVTSVRLEYPTNNYFEKGNKIEVWMDNELIPEEFYTIFEDQLYFEDTSILKNHSHLEIKYLYNENEEIIKEVPKLDIFRSEEELEYKKNVKKYNLSPPLEDYFKHDGMIFVIMGTVLLHPSLYQVNQDTNILTFTDLFLENYKDLENKYMKVIYFYSNQIDIKHVVEDVPVTTQFELQRIFTIPEPFSDYYESGSRFFISAGGTYIVAERYHVKGNTLIFNSEDDGIPPGQVLTFHFIYNEFNNVELNEYTRKIVATENHQTEFDIPVPYDSYFTDGNSVFIKVRGFYMPPKFYSIVKNKLIIDNNYSVYIGGELEFLFIYGKIREIKHTAVNVQATITFQQDFVIPWPYEGFKAKGNKFKVMYEGVELIEGTHFILKGDRIELFSVKDTIPIGDYLQFNFYHHTDNENNITIKETQNRILKEGQKRFTIPVPFYKYFSTGNKMLITSGSTFVPENQYDIVDNRISFHDDCILDLRQDREITYTFIYHTVYEKYNQAIYIDENIHDLTEESENPDGSLKIKIPFPFENYMELGNLFELRVDGTIPIPLEAYDIIDNEYVLIYDPKEYVYSHGKNVQFIFTYSCTGFDTEIVEDLEKDIELKFVKVPLLENPDKYLKNDKGYIQYEDVVNTDPSWNGDFTHEEIKRSIIEKEFSYTRTKYFSISSLASMGEIAYQLPYFMNMLFDNVKLEDRLTLRLPYINTSHIFRFNDTLTYMMALSHRYLGIADDIPNVQRSLYIKGFNFEADLAKISSYITERLGSHNILKSMEVDPVWKEFKIYKDYIPTYKELIEIYTNNTNIYNHVVHEMINADNKAMYDIYKKIYESLMITEESKKYFSINKEVLPTLTEWLRNRDSYLYHSLLEIDQIPDDTDRRSTISKYLEDCIYQISEFIDAEKFRHVLGSFPGANSDALLNYLTKVINFFKSYKVQLYDMSIQYVFDDKLENTLRLIDSIQYNIFIDINIDGHNIFDTLYLLIKKVLKDESIAESIREKIYHVILRYLQLPINDRPDIIPYIDSMISSMIISDEIPIKEFMPFISTILLHSKFEDNIADLLRTTTLLTPYEYHDIKERYLALIRKYILLNPIEEDMIKDDIEEFLAQLTLTVHLIDETIKEKFTCNTIMYLYEIHANPQDQIWYFVSTYKEEFIKVAEKMDVIAKRFELIKAESKYKNIYDQLITYYNTFKPTLYFKATDILMKTKTNLLVDLKISPEEFFKFYVDQYWNLIIKIFDRLTLAVTINMNEYTGTDEAITLIYLRSALEDYGGNKQDVINYWSRVHHDDQYSQLDQYQSISSKYKKLLLSEKIDIVEDFDLKTID